MVIFANSNNSINYDEEILIRIIEASLCECNGVVGAVHEINGKWELLKSEDLTNGIKFIISSNGKLHIELNIMIHFGAKVISSFVVQKIKEDIENCTELNIDFVKVNIKAIDVQKKVIQFNGIQNQDKLGENKEHDKAEAERNTQELINDKPENIEYNNIVNAEFNESELTQRKNYGFIAFASGSGLVKINEELEVDQVIEYNNSNIDNIKTNIILEAASKVNSEILFLLPNDDRLINVCNKVKAISNRNIKVIPCKTVPEGIACLTVFNEEKNIEDNLNEFNKAIESVQTGIVKRSHSDCNIGSKTVKKDDILGFIENDLIELDDDRKLIANNIIDEMITKDSKLISIYYGSEVDYEEAEELKKTLNKRYKQDVQVFEGNQEEYYIISIE